MNLLQMSFTGAVMILAVTVIRALAINKLPKKNISGALGDRTGTADDTVLFALMV